jgi:hypothetical protein
MLVIGLAGVCCLIAGLADIAIITRKNRIQERRERERARHSRRRDR